MWLEIVVAVVVGLVSLKVWFLYTAGRCTSIRSMAGKTVIITGATAGIGKETARDLYRRGARVILACRNQTKARHVAAEIRADEGSGGELVLRTLDTSDLESVRAFAKRVLDTEKAIHVLINNAGIPGSPQRKLSAQGLELTLATNHFGHFLLTNILLGRLKESAPSRIVHVSSMGHSWSGNVDLDDLTLSKSYEPMSAYCISKLFNVLFSRELADKMAGTGVTSNSLHPGVVRTDIFKQIELLKILKYSPMLLFSKDAASGAQTTIHLAVSEEVEGVTGRYFSDCKDVATSELARSKDLAKSLWEASVKVVRLKEHEVHY